MYASQRLKPPIVPVSDYDAAHYHCQERQVTWCTRDRTVVRLQSQLVLQKKCWATQPAFESSVHRGIVTFGQGPSPVTCQYNNVDTSDEALGLQRLNSQTGTEKFCGLSTHCVTSLLRSQVLMSGLGWVIQHMCVNVWTTVTYRREVRKKFHLQESIHCLLQQRRCQNLLGVTDREDDCTTILSKRREPFIQKHNVTPRRHLQPYRCGNLKYRICISFWDARKGHETADRCACACVHVCHMTGDLMVLTVMMDVRIYRDIYII